MDQVVANKWGKTEITKVAKVLDDDFEDGLMGAAQAALSLTDRLLMARLKFCVVGQLKVSDGKRLEPSDPEAIKLCLGWYSTEGEARSAAEALSTGRQSGDEWNVWVLNVLNETPATVHSIQKDKYAALEQKQADVTSERITKSIEKRAKEAEARAAALRAVCECGHVAINHYGFVNSWERCSAGKCRCEKFSAAKGLKGIDP